MKPKLQLETIGGLFLIGVIFTLCIANFGIKAIGGINWEYSEGSRSGVVQKLSKKGVFWKTWEGELNLGYMQATSTEHGQNIAPAIFYFSVENEEVAKELVEAEKSGKRVTVEYKQYFMRGYNKGGTSYDIVDVNQ